MARKTPSRLDKRREVEAAEARGGARKKKKASRKTATRSRRTKSKAPTRKRLMWAVFNGSMKEEARFSYDQRKEAEEKLEQLRAKSSKKLYFIQPVKEALAEAPATAKAAAGKGKEEE